MVGERPQPVHDLPGPADVRVVAVREVLAGGGLGEVARRHEVDVSVLHRWVTAFLDAGTAQVTNRPVGEAQRQRDRFLAAFAHETRTPLAAARGWIDLLREDSVPPHLVGPTLDRLDEALTRLEDRARDVELLAAASLGLVHPHPVPLTLRDLLDDAGGADLDVAVDEDVELHADPELMSRVVRDLADAARRPPEPAAVSVQARRAGPWVELRVVRRGPPIPTPVLQALFEPFDLDHQDSGITIGLYLARALAVVHGGTLGAEQDEETTTFWVRVPASNATGPVAANPEEVP